jgi:hypothetical protein
MSTSHESPCINYSKEKIFFLPWAKLNIFTQKTLRVFSSYDGGILYWWKCFTFKHLFQFGYSTTWGSMWLHTCSFPLSCIGNINDLQMLPLISQTSNLQLVSSSLYPDKICKLQQPVPDVNVHYYDKLYLYSLRIPWPPTDNWLVTHSFIYLHSINPYKILDNL